MTVYCCKYTPVELLEALGADCLRLDAAPEDTSAADAMTHGNICSHARAVLEQCAALAPEAAVFVNCCDSMRRCRDAAAHAGAGFTALLDLPHVVSDYSVRAFGRSLTELAEKYEKFSGRSFDRERFFAAFAPAEPLPEGDFIALAGARPSRELLALAREKMPLPTADATCSGSRGPARPQDGGDFAALMENYARCLLEQTPCMRMRDVSRRGQALESPNLRGVIYHTVKFCDFYPFEFEKLKNRLNVPVLKIETDFTAQSAGQLATRLEAFAEGLGKFAPATPAASPASCPAAPAAPAPESSGGAAAPGTSPAPVKPTPAAPGGKSSARPGYAAGIDSGSTSTNMVILDMEGNVAAGVAVRTGARAENGAKKALELALERAGIDKSQLRRVVATGYGRAGVPFADRAVTEITCHARGAARVCPQARTVIDIGGQDSKVITLAPDGSVKAFVMNDKCAAGTGRFLEKMAQVLEMDMEAFCAAGLGWKRDIAISSVCTVFAESEVVSLIAENCREEDIIHGLNRSVAAKTAGLAGRVKAAPPYMMTGGVARNAGVVKALSQALGEDILVGPEPELCGALGAALFALDDCKED